MTHKFDCVYIFSWAQNFFDTDLTLFSNVASFFFFLFQVIDD